MSQLYCCPGCSLAVEISDSHLGQKATCPHCGESFNTSRPVVAPLPPTALPTRFPPPLPSSSVPFLAQFSHGQKVMAIALLAAVIVWGGFAWMGVKTWERDWKVTTGREWRQNVVESCVGGICPAVFTGTLAAAVAFVVIPKRPRS